jgi:RecB family endonuclease NucS
MPIYHIADERLEELPLTTFSANGLRERSDIQRLLRSQIEIVSPDTLVIAEEFSEWEDSRRRIDLLGIDREANLVVIELKRTEDGGHMELQALRYAAMISAMTFERAVEVYGAYLRTRGDKRDARGLLLEFLGLDEPDEDSLAQDVRIVLVAADFSKEVTTAALWLGDHGIDIRCVRLRPYRDGQRVLIDVQQLIPLAEAEEFQVRLREKAQKARMAKTTPLTEQRLLQQLEARHGPKAPEIAKELLEWITSRVSYIYWGKGEKRPGAVAIKMSDQVRYHILRIGCQGEVVFRVDRLHLKPPFDQPAVRHELVNRLNQLPGIELSVNHLRCRPRLTINSLADLELLEQLKNTVEWIVKHVP